MRIIVGKEHITNGKAKNSQHCMIADAIRDCCPKAQFIMVDLQSIRFSVPDKRKRFVYLTPAIAQSSLLKFDKGDPVKPFSFSLTSPVRATPMATTRTSEERRASHKRANRKYRKNQKRRDYGYLAANRARNHQKEREFGLRKFVE